MDEDSEEFVSSEYILSPKNTGIRLTEKFFRIPMHSKCGIELSGNK